MPAGGVQSVTWTTMLDIRRRLSQLKGLTDEAEFEATVPELQEAWVHVATAAQKRRGLSILSGREREFVDIRVWQSVRELDPTGKTQINVDEWLHHVLLTRSCPRGMKAMMLINMLVESALERCPGILVSLQHAFEAADGVNTGLPASELFRVFAQKLWAFRPASPISKESGRAGHVFSLDVVDGFVAESVQALDIDSSGVVTPAEFLSLCLGRRERDVVLNMYDLSRGVARAVSPWLLSEPLQGVWHSAVVIFGKEYYFGGDIYYDTPGATGFGKPIKSIWLGSTLRLQDDFHTFIVDELRPSFCPEAYDAAKNNCNHFSDRLAMYLVGKHIPDDILRQPDLVLNTKVGQVLRPVLNRWLGVYFEPRDGAAKVVGGQDAAAHEAEAQPGSTVQL